MAFSTDTRTLRPGDTFVAIRGERFDGHDFVADAFAKGAAHAVVERPLPMQPLTVVDSAVEYLAACAQRKIRSAQCRTVAITGSVGKTTTKNAIAQVLSGAGPVVASQGNLNTELGLALTLANGTYSACTRLVLEMGASRKGDLTAITRYFKPDISVVTNVQGVHLDTFGSIDGVRDAKSELVRALDTGGTACLNADDPRTRSMAADCAGLTVLYGTAPDAHVTPADITASMPLLGAHVIYVAMAAFAVGQASGMDPESINRALENLKPEKGRLRRLPGRADSVLIDDSYNASPSAMAAALDVLASFPARRRIALLGDMLELGDIEHEEHVRALQQALCVADRVWVAGPRMAAAYVALKRPAAIEACADSAALAEAVASNEAFAPDPGDVYLVKGSQGVRMERISRSLLAPAIDPADVLPRQSESWLAI